MFWLMLIGCTMDEPPDLHVRCDAPAACGDEWIRRCEDETGLLVHWDTAEGHVSLWKPERCEAR